MTRTHLLGAASAAALACLSTHSFAASTIVGGGSTLAQYDYIAEFNLFNSTTSTATFGTYYAAGSGAGQAGFLNDDLTCLTNKISGNNGGNCTGGSGVGQPGNVVDYAASDATLSSTQISTWQSYPYGQAAAGNLIQLASMGVGIAIPVQNSAVTSNGALILDDKTLDANNDLCGVFSGKITDFSGLHLEPGSVAPASGAITVVYRSDGSGTTFLLTNHLSAVCNSSNSNVTFTATTSFASLFAGGVPPGNFIGEKGSSAVAAELATLSSAIGYISPDFTSIDPNSNAPTHTLIVAAVENTTKGYTPTTKNITAGLKSPKMGQNLTPPNNAADGANPALWVPLIQLTKTGYPIVGYTTFDFAQCYADPTIAAGILSFMDLHYEAKPYLAIENNNGFVAVANSGAAKFVTAAENIILGNSSGFNDNIQNATACAGKTGR